MNIIKHRSWRDLPEIEKVKITAALQAHYEAKLRKTMQEYADRIEVDLQTVWIKLACIALYKCGVGEDTLAEFMASWPSIYRWNRKFGDTETQSEKINEELLLAFPTRGFPQEILDRLKKI